MTTVTLATKKFEVRSKRFMVVHVNIDYYGPPQLIKNVVFFPISQNQLSTVQLCFPDRF